MMRKIKQNVPQQQFCHHKLRIFNLNTNILILILTNKTTEVDNINRYQETLFPFTASNRWLKKTLKHCARQTFLIRYARAVCLPPHCINMRIISPILLFKTLNITRRHCDGTRYTVVAACATLITARKLDF